MIGNLSIVATAFGLIFVFAINNVSCCDIESYDTIFDSELPIVSLKKNGASYKLSRALKEWGFSYITGHDIPKEVIHDAYVQNKRFFDLPERIKRDLQADRRQSLKTARGYTQMNDEQLDGSPTGKPDIKEVFDVGYTDPSAGSNARHHLGTNKWPKLESSNEFDGENQIGEKIRNGIDKYAFHVSRLAKGVLGAVFNELDCQNEFEDVFGPNALQVQRLTRYPTFSSIVEPENGQIGAGAHSDYGGITILSADGQGLFVLKPNKTSEYQEKGTFSDELLVPTNNHWIEVPSVKNTFIVMAGEALQRLSNGQIYAAKHKVELPETKPRHSLAFFYDPNPTALLKPLRCATGNDSPIYGAKIAGHKGVIRNK